MILIHRLKNPEIFASGVARKVQNGVEQWLRAQIAGEANVAFPTIPPLKRSPRFYSKLLSLIFDAFYSKCACCETKLDKRESQLLHYRPFTLKPGEKPNYIWLSWQWPNIYLVCEACYHSYSRNGQITTFPLLSPGKHVTLEDVEFEKLFDVSYLNQVETPIFLDPCWDNAEEFLGYEEDEQGAVNPYALEENSRAKITIEFFSLDREQLGKFRQQALDTFRLLFKEIRSGESDYIPLMLLKECAKEAEFAGMKRFFLRQWLNEESFEIEDNRWEEIRRQLQVWREETAVPSKPCPALLDMTSKIQAAFTPSKKNPKIIPPLIENQTKKTSHPLIDLVKIGKYLSEIDDEQFVTALQKILQKMFHDVDVVIIKGAFNAGFSSAQLFHVQPKKGTRSQLPRVVKIDKDWKIEQEFKKSSEIRNYVPDAIVPIGSIEASGIGWSGIQYRLGGNSKTEIISLKNYLKKASLDNIQLVLSDELFPTMERFWSKQTEDDYFWRKYDLLLPANLEIAYKTTIDTPDFILTPNNLLLMLPKVKEGHTIQLSGFQQIEYEKDELNFNLPDQTCRIKMILNHGEFSHEGEYQGEVVKTRYSILLEKIQQALRKERCIFDVNAETILLPDITEVNNPLLKIETLLNDHSDVYISGLIHGDLNLENVLVEFDSNNYPQGIALIDFAAARENDHVLHDFLRLETSIWLYLATEELSGKDTIQAVSQLFKALLLPDGLIPKAFASLKSFHIFQAIREMAKPYLRKQQWDEYFRGLTLYMIGALKFDNLDELKTVPSPKILAFWVACLANHYVENGGFAAKVGADFLENDSAKSYEASNKAAMPESKINHSEPAAYLHDEIDSYFTLDGLREMCYELSVVDFENLPGQTRKQKAMSLVKHCVHLDEIPKLLAYCKRKRPNREWEYLKI